MNRPTHNAGTPSPSNVGFEEFVEPEIRHEFSTKYQAKRRTLIEEVAKASGEVAAKTAVPRTDAATAQTALESGTPAKSVASNVKPRATSRFTWRAVAAVAAACIVVPTAAWAVTTHGDFFSGAFGDGWRTSQPAKETFQDHGEEKPPTPVVYPASDVMQQDPEVAETLVGYAVCDEPLTVTSPDGHELTITSAVRSENALVYQFTLHRDGGVTCLHWDESTNNVAAKGAYTPHNAQMSWSAAGDEFIYIDPTTSTEDTLVGYSYSVFGSPLPEGQTVPLTVFTCDVPFEEDFTEDQFHEQTYEIPCTSVVASSTFANDEGGSLALSPLGLALDMHSLFAEPDDPESYDMAEDPIHLRSIAVNLNDGTTYTVFDNVANSDNTLSLSNTDGNLSLAFNRLVDPSQIASIDVSITDAQDMSFADDADTLPAPEDWPTRTVSYYAA